MEKNDNGPVPGIDPVLGPISIEEAERMKKAIAAFVESSGEATKRMSKALEKLFRELSAIVEQFELLAELGSLEEARRRSHEPWRATAFSRRGRKGPQGVWWDGRAQAKRNARRPQGRKYVRRPQG